MEVLTGKPLSARARQIAKSQEELLGLLSGLPDSDHELSLTDLVEITKPNHNNDAAAPVITPPKRKETRSESTATSKQATVATAVPKERRVRRRDSRGSCGGSGDGVLLNFYLPGLLTRSMTAPRQGRGPAAAGHGAPEVAAGKVRMEAPREVGCWPVLWGRSRDRRKPGEPSARRRDLRVPA